MLFSFVMLKTVLHINLRHCLIFSISEYRDVEFFEHVFPLKKDVPHVVSNVVLEHVNLPASSSSVRDLAT